MKQILILMSLTLLLGAPSYEQLSSNYLTNSNLFKIENTKLDFTAQYIRTDGYNENVKYPVVTLITSTTDLNKYYNRNKDKYDLERKKAVYFDTPIGFLDACDRYNDDYFKDKDLIIVLIEEGSGSIRHEIKSIVGNTDKKYEVTINRIMPEVRTWDMAEWHLLIEIPKKIIVSPEQLNVIFTE